MKYTLPNGQVRIIQADQVTTQECYQGSLKIRRAEIATTSILQLYAKGTNCNTPEFD